MKQYKKIRFSIGIFILMFLFSPKVYAATLELALDKNIVNAKDDITILVTLNSEDKDVNTSQATISFPSNLLEVTKIDRTNSIFTFWLQEPVYDNSKGTISFVGGSTSGFSGASLKIFQVGFKVKGSGSGRLGVTDGAITASDGTGSNVYNTSKGLDINIPTTAQFQSVKIEQAKIAATTAKELPAKLGLEVPFYPDQTKWNNRSASFQAKWIIGSDTTKAGIAVNKNSTFVPDASSDALIGNKIFSALPDGVWYLHLRVANNIGWSPTLHYKIAVDTTPPTPFKITSDTGFKTINSTPSVSYASSDLTSGIYNYVIHLDGQVVTTTNINKYKFEPLLPGTHQLIVSAYDNAGNSTSQSQTLEILPIESPVISYVTKSLIVDDGGITAGGTSSVGKEIIVQVKNSQKQIIFEQIVPVDVKGNWNIFINKSFIVGDYNLVTVARDKNMSSSFPVESEVIKVKVKPMLVIGSLEINQTWFFVDLIFVLLASFGMGWFSYHNWKGRLGQRLTIAQRDVVNVLDNTKKDIDKMLKNYKDGILSESSQIEMEYTLKKIKDNIEKSNLYIIDNIRGINKK